MTKKAIIALLLGLFVSTAAGAEGLAGKAQKADSTVTEKPIVLVIDYKGKNGNARKFVEEMTKSGDLAKIQAEEGCLRYEYFFSAENPENALLIENWANKEALSKHQSTPIMKRIGERRKKYQLTR